MHIPGARGDETVPALEVGGFSSSLNHGIFSEAACLSGAGESCFLLLFAPPLFSLFLASWNSNLTCGVSVVSGILHEVLGLLSCTRVLMG